MSDAMMVNLTNMAESFSGEELVSAISIFTERLKKVFAAETKPKISKEEQALQELFDHADALHLSSNGEKWTREELYER